MVLSLLVMVTLVAAEPVVDQPAPAVPTAAPARPPAWAQSLTRPGLPNLHLVAPGVYRGAQPTAEGMRELEKLGVKMVINLRGLHDDDDELEGTALTGAHIRFNTWHAEDEDVVRFLELVGNPANQPVFIHCLHGADRTGTMCAIYRMAIQGWAAEAAITEMTEGGFGYHSVWTNLPRYLRALDVAKLRVAAGLPVPALAP